MTTKPTTSDMTVSKILDDFGSAVVDVALKLYDDPYYKFKKDHDTAHKQALAAIEAYYAAKERADMEYVIGKNAPPSSSRVLIRNQLRDKQRQRMAERLNNTEEQI